MSFNGSILRLLQYLFHHHPRPYFLSTIGHLLLVGWDRNFDNVHPSCNKTSQVSITISLPPFSCHFHRISDDGHSKVMGGTF